MEDTTRDLITDLRRGKMTRRQFLKTATGMGFSMAAAVSLLEACAPQPTAPAGATPTIAQAATPTTAQAATPAGGEKLLVVAGIETPPGIDQDFHVSPMSIEAMGVLNDRFAYWKKIPAPNDPSIFIGDYSIQGIDPLLVESWEISPDYTVYTLHLRQGVMSHAGNEHTAEDVKWSYDRKFGTEAIGTFFTGVLGLEGPDSVEVVDKYTVRFTSKWPNSELVFFGANANMDCHCIDSVEAKKHATSDDPWATEWLRTNEAGHGPYRLDSIEPGEQSVFLAFEDYWGGRPPIDKVVVRAVPSSATRKAMLEAGTVDVAEWLSPLEIQDLSGKPGITISSVPANLQLRALMNPNSGPLASKAVRQALCYATPYDDILQSVYFGRARRMNAIDAGWGPDYSNGINCPYEYDPNKAKGLLEEGGYAEGFDLTLSYDAGRPEQEPIAILMQSSFAEIGVKLTLDKVPATTYTEKLTKKEYPFVLFQEYPTVPDIGYTGWLYYHSKAFTNYCGYSNPEVDQLIDEGMGIVDPEKRRETFWRAEAIIMDDAMMVPIAYPGYHLAHRDYVTGFTWYTANNLRYDPLDITK
jgi:peptide/nickel transport system substrate-binding protein